MKHHSLFVLIIVTALSVSTVYSQDALHYFIPYGGSGLPYLSTGEYIISFSGSSSDSKYTRSFDSLRESGENRYMYYYVDLNGAFAISEQFLIHLNLDLFPSQTSSVSKYSTPSWGYDNSDETDTYIRPQLSLVYRPSRSIEIFGTFSYLSNSGSENNKYLDGGYPYENEQWKIKETQNYFAFGLTYRGKF